MTFSRISNWILIGALTAVGAETARAHKVSAVSVVAEIDTVKRSFKVELAMDVDPTGDPAIDDQIPPEAAATAFATEALTLYFDDQAVSVEPEIRIVTESDEATPEELQRKKVIGALRGSIPGTAENFLVHVSENTEAAVVMVVIKDGKPARRLQVLYPGEFSNPVSVLRMIEGDPFQGTAGKKEEAAGEPAGKIPPDDPVADREATGQVAAGGPGASPGRGNAVKRASHAESLRSGARAMLAGGLDLWLFGFAIVLLSVKPGPVIRQMVPWLVAQALGFSLAKTGWVNPSLEVTGQWVAIGAAILAIDNLFNENARLHRSIAVVAFGFFQGMVLARLYSLNSGLEKEGWVALAGWLGGAEAMVAGLVLLLWLVLGPLAPKRWFRDRVRTPVCVLIAGISVFRGLEFFL